MNNDGNLGLNADVCQRLHVRAGEARVQAELVEEQLQGGAQLHPVLKGE
jgi:hypothetical protein